MIGKPISATLWQINYSFEKAPSEIVDAKGESKSVKVEGPITISTADPTGADLCAVAFRVVKDLDEHPDRVTEFKLEHVHRIGCIHGLAQVHEPEAN